MDSLIQVIELMLTFTGNLKSEAFHGPQLYLRHIGVLTEALLSSISTHVVNGYLYHVKHLSSFKP